MGMVYADIKLINNIDFEKARENIIGEEEIRGMTVRMLVDSGSSYLVINENIQEYLKLPFIRKRRLVLANGVSGVFDIVGPVRVEFQDREAGCNAVVMKGDNEPLLGAIPMEELDVIIHPKRQELVGNPDHPPGGLWRL